jgi:hypothetical protein
MTGVILLILRAGLALALYAFLGWALWTLYRELNRQSRRAAAQFAPPLNLRELDAEARPGAAQWQFTALEAKLGRDPASDLVLEDKTISAQHARLNYHHRQWWVEDLRSTNGTYLNEEPVTAPVVLTDGDHLRLGGLVFQVQLASQANQDLDLGENPT